MVESVKKTNRCLVVEENKPFCGVGAQIISLVQERAFDYLDGPIERISSLDAPQIYSMPLEKIQIPDAARVVSRVLKML